MYSMPENFGLSRHKKDNVVTGLCCLSSYPNLQAARWLAVSSAAVHLASAHQASLSIQALAGANPSWLPSGSLCKESAPGKDMLPFLHLAHAHQRLPELVIGPGNPACSLCGTYHRYLPGSQTSPQLPCFLPSLCHSCVACQPPLPMPLFCWDISFTYIPHSRVNPWDSEIHPALRPLTLWKRKRISLDELPHMCAALSLLFAFIISFMPCKNCGNGCNTVHIKDKKTEAHKGQIT